LRALWRPQITLCPPGDCLPQKTIPTLQQHNQYHEIHNKTDSQQCPENTNMTSRHKPNRRELSYDLSIRDFGSGPEKMSQRVSIGVRKSPGDGEGVSGVSSGGSITKFNPHGGSLHQKAKRVITQMKNKNQNFATPSAPTRNPQDLKPASTCRQGGSSGWYKDRIFWRSESSLGIP